MKLGFWFGLGLGATATSMVMCCECAKKALKKLKK